MLSLTYIFKVIWIRWPDTVRSFWQKLDENRLPVYGVGDIKLFLFCFFWMTHFPPGQWRLSCATTSNNAPHFYRTRVEYLDDIHIQFSNWLNSFRESWLYIFHSNWKRWKSSLWKRDKLVLSPFVGFKVRWNFATIYCRLWDPLA